MRQTRTTLALLAILIIGLIGSGVFAQDSTDILLIDLPGMPTDAPYMVSADAVTYLTDNDSYDNQPSFTPDGAAVLYVAMQEDGQTEIFRYDLAAGEAEQLTRTEESEFSPVVTPDGEHISAVRIEADGVTQRLWQFDLAGQNAEPLPENVERVGYYSYANADTVVFFIVGEGEGGQPFTLESANVTTGDTETITENIGVGVQKVPSQEAVSFIQTGAEGETTINVLDVSTGDISTLTETLPEVSAHTWLPDGTVLMAQDSTVYSWQEGQESWQPFLDFNEANLSGPLSRMAVSPDGSKLALVMTRAGADQD